jgi:hypothetical protein
MVDFILRHIARNWAGPALIAFGLFVLLFSLSGQTVNAPFVYYTPK